MCYTLLTNTDLALVVDVSSVQDHILLFRHQFGFLPVFGSTKSLNFFEIQFVFSKIYCQLFRGTDADSLSEILQPSPTSMKFFLFFFIQIKNR